MGDTVNNAMRDVVVVSMGVWWCVIREWRRKRWVVIHIQ